MPIIASMNRLIAICPFVIAACLNAHAAVSAREQAVGDLAIVIRGATTTSGYISITVSDSEASFLNRDKPFAIVRTRVTPGVTTVVLKGIPRKDYAVSAFHDANGNNTLDRNVRGIPKERYGFSNDPSSGDNTPSYYRCRFRLESPETTVVIRLR
jgi:uncharacterized protein (DUF2141 family)